MVNVSLVHDLHLYHLSCGMKYFCLEFAAGRATAVSAREHCKFAGSKSWICTAIRSSGSGRRITSWEKAANAKYCKVSRDTNKTNKVYTSSWKSEQPNFQEIHPSRGKRTAQWRTTACKISEHQTNRHFKNSSCKFQHVKFLLHSRNFMSPHASVHLKLPWPLLVR